MNFFNYLDQNYIDEYVNGHTGNSTLSINVKNAKNTDNRSFGLYRQIILSNINHDKLSWITGFKSLLEKAIAGKTGHARIKAANNYFKTLQKSLQSAMEILNIPKKKDQHFIAPGINVLAMLRKIN